MELDGALRIFCTHLTSWRTIAIYCGIAQITVNERFIRLFRPQACTRSFHVVRLTVWKWGQATSKPSEPVPNSSRGLPSKAVEVRELTPGCPWGNEARSPLIRPSATFSRQAGEAVKNTGISLGAVMGTRVSACEILPIQTGPVALIRPSATFSRQAGEAVKTTGISLGAVMGTRVSACEILPIQTGPVALIRPSATFSRQAGEAVQATGITVVGSIKNRPGRPHPAFGHLLPQSEVAVQATSITWGAVRLTRVGGDWVPRLPHGWVTSGFKPNTVELDASPSHMLLCVWQLAKQHGG